MTELVFFQPYPMSPRNSPQGVAHMLETTSCHRILAQASTASLTYQVQTEMASRGVDVRIDNLPGLYDVFPQLQDTEAPGGSKAKFKPYPPSSQPINLLETSMYIHSSGSTGPPKSIHFTYQRCLQWMRNDSKHLPLTMKSNILIPSQISSVDLRQCTSGHWAFPASTGWDFFFSSHIRL